MRKEIEGFQGYFIEENGKIWSNKTNQYLNPSTNKLVGIYFLENPNNYLEINHKDEDKANNSVTNLEWCDKKYNLNYGTRLSKIRKKVKCIETNEIYDSITDAAEKTSINRGHINSVCQGKRKTAGGFHWEYLT